MACLVEGLQIQKSWGSVRMRVRRRENNWCGVGLGGVVGNVCDFLGSEGECKGENCVIFSR